MALPPLVFTDFSLLFAVGTIVLLLTAELSSPYYGHTNFTVNRRKLKDAAYATGIIFLITACVTIVQILLK